MRNGQGANKTLCSVLPVRVSLAYYTSLSTKARNHASMKTRLHHPSAPRWGKKDLLTLVLATVLSAGCTGGTSDTSNSEIKDALVEGLMKMGVGCLQVVPPRGTDSFPLSVPVSEPTRSLEALAKAGLVDRLEGGSTKTFALTAEGEQAFLGFNDRGRRPGARFFLFCYAEPAIENITGMSEGSVGPGRQEAIRVSYSYRVGPLEYWATHPAIVTQFKRGLPNTLGALEEHSMVLVKVDGRWKEQSLAPL